MNVRRLMAIAVTACAAGLSAAACSVGVTSAGTATSHSPTPSHVASLPTTSSSPTTSPSQTKPASADLGDTVNVQAPFGPFPIPHGAQVVANMPCGKQILILIGPVTPRQASVFYTSALPRAGFKIDLSTLGADPDTGTPQGIAEITFTGHGYSGMIIALANLGPGSSASDSAVSMPTRNTVEISLNPPGTASTSKPACSG